MSNNNGLGKGDILFIAFLVLLVATGGFLVRNVFVNLQRTESLDFSLQTDLDRWEQKIQDFVTGLGGLTGDRKPRSSPASPTPAPPAAKSDPASQATEVTSLRFFESDQNAPAARQRNYQQRFSRDSRIIYSEIGYKNKYYQQKDAEIAVRVEFWGSNGQRAGLIQGISRPKKEWATVLYIIRWPRPDTGGWKPDQYNVKVFMDNTLVREGRFEIF